MEGSPTLGPDNLGNHIATQSIIPSAAASFDLGSTSNAFKNLFVSNAIDFGNSPLALKGGALGNYIYCFGTVSSLGYNAGGPSGNNCTFLGTGAKAQTGTETNATALGYNAVVAVSNGIVFGNNSAMVGIHTSSPAYPLQVGTAYCDGLSWYSVSDLNLKENFRSISNEGILDKLMTLKVQRWVYKNDSTNADHIGPVAQDFKEVFAVGSNDKAISSVDEMGIALAAIQELNSKVESLSKVVKDQQSLIGSMMESKIENQGTSASEVPGAKLYQNAPNPFRTDTKIKMDIPDGAVVVMLYIYDLKGTQIHSEAIKDKGTVVYTVNAGSLSSGLYLYSLVIDGHVIGVNRMILTN